MGRVLSKVLKVYGDASLACRFPYSFSIHFQVSPSHSSVPAHPMPVSVFHSQNSHSVFKAIILQYPFSLNSFLCGQILQMVQGKHIILRFHARLHTWEGVAFFFLCLCYCSQPILFPISLLLHFIIPFFKIRQRHTQKLIPLVKMVTNFTIKCLQTNPGTHQREYIS